VNLRHRTILRTIEIPGAGGTIDRQVDPGRSSERGYPPECWRAPVFVGHKAWTAKAVFDFATISKAVAAVAAITRDGRRLSYP